MALLLVIAALVAGRVLLGTFLPGLLLVAAIAIIAVTVAVGSGQSVARKATFISATVLVVALAIPASLKVVYPVYHHFFNDGSSQASRDESPQASPSFGSPSSQASSDETPQASPPSRASAAPSSAPTRSPITPRLNAKIVIDGQTIDPVADCTDGSKGQQWQTCLGALGVTCPSSSTGVGIKVGGTAYTHLYVEGELTPGDPPTMVSLSLVTGNANSYRAWDIKPSDSTSVTKNGKTYKITGTITPVAVFGRSPTGPAVPFEVDATCP